MMLINGSPFCFTWPSTKASIIRIGVTEIQYIETDLYGPTVLHSRAVRNCQLSVSSNLSFLHFFGCSTFFKLFVSEEDLLLFPFNSETTQAQENIVNRQGTASDWRNHLCVLLQKSRFHILKFTGAAAPQLPGERKDFTLRHIMNVKRSTNWTFLNKVLAKWRTTNGGFRVLKPSVK